MDETKVQIGKEVLLDIGVHSEWYISAVGYNGESVDVVLRRKADRSKEWLADTPQTDCETCKHYGVVSVSCDRCDKSTHDRYEPQTDCGWGKPDE
jgi:hypothetical protein